MSQYWASGKLLLSGEYAVLQGVEAIAVPTLLGQHLSFKSGPDRSGLQWRALDEKDQCWFSLQLDAQGQILETSDAEAAEKLSALLRQAWGPQWPLSAGLVETRLEFPRAWGLGSSSSLVALLSAWSGAEAMPLFFAQMSGSAYDLAVALARQSIRYRLVAPAQAHWSAVSLPHFFAESLLVYRGQKQNSAREVARFQKQVLPAESKAALNALSSELLRLPDMPALAQWMERHERLLAPWVALTPIKEALFPDYPGGIKSLGAWGGDFFWASASAGDEQYFRNKGYSTLFRFKDLCKMG